MLAKLAEPVVKLAYWSEFNPMNVEEEPAL